MNNNWGVYNKCLLANKLPHEEIKVENIKGIINESKALFARWTSEFDCKQQTEWWYVIKDNCYDISKMKSKYRCEINKGKKNFDVKIINPLEYEEDIRNVFFSANESYSKLSKNKGIVDPINYNKTKTYIAAFDKDNNELSAYAICKLLGEDGKLVLEMCALKSKREKNVKGVNAAIIDFICDYYLNEKCVMYIYDGERSIRHITNFQDYLIKLFGFRKAYCKLNIIYSKKMQLAIKILYPFRSVIKVIGNKNRIAHNVYCTLFQEQIRRSFKGEKNV